ncbi:precorrin-6y C5,15-methyltransferase (decarboxylating), CbiE subunit,precorrin-6Y C5,15-methyltransferase (decarboxylating), CbiT subunit (plasmid) [Thermus oshimai JL-2]|uniref:Precorrin-6y C5,15-methyltransferase (Decarboxylating), CbiE subunit,precorrin-6Y C5,15-methyltransferase (Decarboxylating), CbiT subunit n=1 Tax=Thermus oshimai JL-2 TaxID=751945 RepID=K7QWU0_THEOS|nr:bifunctional cobalt-precorrin-7 (C(5))-methyltransferase/cobalt-precorrin-6B (C(15))-methyltransferase [Thermus oshimai]AFV77306.1 precorrin-6y C5,15-methyltransferase (decarboxylating), CbiE subunit,precorrin-6Y C5,15-methyltransferase (decarboxylating), CbiT subunit [Thermus oshimai JL-2]
MVYVVGMGARGRRGLSLEALEAIGRSRLLIGGRRHLSAFPEHPGEKVPVQGPLEPLLDLAEARVREGQEVAFLASGDPLFYGIGKRVLERFPEAQVFPAPTAFQEAFARLKRPWDGARFFSLHGRPLGGLLLEIALSPLAVVYTDPEHTPSRLAALLLEMGVERRAHVAERLGEEGERVRSFGSLEEVSAAEFQDPNVLILEAEGPLPPRLGFLPDEAFEKRMPKRGLITKREVRLLALGLLALPPDGVLWDIGAGTGSVGIEAARLAPYGTVYAVEKNPESWPHILENARRHGAHNLVLIQGEAPGALEGLPTPDAVFVGGSGGELPGILERSLAALKPGGRLVVAAITLENLAAAYGFFQERGLLVEGLQVQASRLVPVGPYRRLEAQNPTVLLAATKEGA